MSIRCTIIALFLTVQIYGQSWSEPPANEITIATPAAAIPAGPSVQLAISGLSDAELGGTSVTVTPTTGTSLVPALDWTKKPIVLFGSTIPGKYSITVTLNPSNEWKATVIRSLAVGRDPKMSTELLAEYDAFASGFAKKLNDKYPYKSGTVLVEVAGLVPNPPQPPKPEPPVTAGKRVIVIIHEQTDDTTKTSDLFVKLRHPAGEVSKYLKEKGHMLDILDQQNVNQRWLTAAGDKPLPVLIIADAASFAVLAVEPLNLSMTPADFIAKVKATGG